MPTLDAELAYLDAIGSTLNNPRSSLRGKLRERGAALRSALQSVPGGSQLTVKGGTELGAYSAARVSR